MARRGNGEGSIYKRKDGSWVGVITLSRDGQRRAFYGKTRAVVKERLAAAAGDQVHGKLPTGRRETLGAYLDRWLVVVASRGLKPSTMRHYTLIVRHLKAGLGSIDLDKLELRDVEEYLATKQRTLSTQTVNHHRAVLRTALNQARKWKLIYSNAAADADAPRVTAKPSRFLSQDEAGQVLEAVTGDRLEALYRVALALGLRQGEALGLQWGDVDLERRQLHVRRQLQRIDRVDQLVDLKTKQSRRTLTMPMVVVAALQEHRLRQADDKVRAMQGLVFCRPDGQPLNGTSVTHRFQARMRDAGLGHLRFHDLRHSCASLLAAQGVSPRVIMETLGHSTITTTLNIYAHVLPTLMQESADAMDRALARRATTATTTATQSP